MKDFDKQRFDDSYETLLKQGVIEESTSEIQNALWDLWVEAWDLGHDTGLDDAQWEMDAAYEEGYESGMEDAEANA